MLQILGGHVEKLESVKLFEFGQKVYSVCWSFEMAIFASSVVLILPSELHAISHALSTGAKAVTARWKLLITANLASWAHVNKVARMPFLLKIQRTFAGSTTLASSHVA